MNFFLIYWTVVSDFFHMNHSFLPPSSTSSLHIYAVGQTVHCNADVKDEFSGLYDTDYEYVWLVDGKNYTGNEHSSTVTLALFTDGPHKIETTVVGTIRTPDNSWLIRRYGVASSQIIIKGPYDIFDVRKITCFSYLNCLLWFVFCFMNTSLTVSLSGHIEQPH